MAITITMGIQKGGSGKSTTTGILSHLLGEDGYRVLAIDMDSQGNLSELLTNKPANNFVEHSILEAMQYNDPKKYIVNINDHLDLLAGNNFLATFPRWIYTSRRYTGEKIPYSANPSLILNRTLDVVANEYDFIVIDTPPSLSEQTTNALAASDYVVVMYECSNWCYSAIPNFMDSITAAQDVSSKNVEAIGILRTMNDIRRNDAKAFNNLIAEDYPSLVFDTIITRKAPIGRLSLYGFEDNKELNKAIYQYKTFYKELINRVRNK
ncbi:ParA family protein [Lentibacillus cibarius]|uniref:ParA family protein n=1 Tax=Lentibacillus cibarius TaxID=2583219 RepID=A0A5S3QLI0_9BACI|nr:ParA family protein [Lentibacillus cibarius]TMN22720.1 ParA family protein [Lentibacillus cibarius]